MIDLEKHIELSHDPAIQKCLGVAQGIHTNDCRVITGNPYIVHCVATALILQRLRFSNDVICGALLHDTVEEHPDAVTFEDLEDMIACREIPRKRARVIVNLVRAVTIDPDWPTEDIYELYCESVEKNPEAIPIAIADRCDNTRDVLENLRLGRNVFGPNMLNCNPNAMMTDIFRVLTSCLYLANGRDRRRVALLGNMTARFVKDILSLVKKPRLVPSTR